MPPQDNCVCPHCKAVHFDVDEWALKLHKTHLCNSCGQLFEGNIKGSSNPVFTVLFLYKHFDVILEFDQ